MTGTTDLFDPSRLLPERSGLGRVGLALQETARNLCNAKFRRQWLACFFATLTMVIVGTVYGWTTISLLHLTSGTGGVPLTLTHDESSWIVSLTVLGSMFGSLVGAKMADLIGRKYCLLLCCAIFTLGWLNVYTAPSVLNLYLARVILGIGVGIAYTINPMYVSEIADVSIRGALGTLIAVNVFTGSLFTCILGHWLSYNSLVIILVIASSTSFLLNTCFPETPYFLVAKRRKKQACQSISYYKDMANPQEVKIALRALQPQIGCKLQPQVTNDSSSLSSRHIFSSQSGEAFPSLSLQELQTDSRVVDTEPKSDLHLPSSSDSQSQSISVIHSEAICYRQPQTTGEVPLKPPREFHPLPTNELHLPSRSPPSTSPPSTSPPSTSPPSTSPPSTSPPSTSPPSTSPPSRSPPSRSPPSRSPPSRSPPSTSEVHPPYTSEIQPGPTSEIQSESTSEIQPEPTSETHPEPTSEIQPESTSETHTEPTSETHPEPTSETHPEPTSETHTEPTSETHPEPTSETHPEPTSEIHPENTSERHRPSTSEIHRPSTGEIHRPSTSEIHRPSTGEIHRPSASEIHRPSASEIHRPSTSEMHEPSTSEKQRPSTIEIHPGATREIYPQTNSELPSQSSINFPSPCSCESCTQSTVETCTSIWSKELYVDVTKQTWLTKLRVILQRNNRKALFIMLGLIMAQQLGGNFITMQYLEVLFSKTTIGMEPSIATILVLTVGLISGTLSTLTVESLGRRKLLILSTIGSCLTLIILATYLLLDQLKIDVSIVSALPVIDLIIYQVMFQIGLGTLPNVLLCELFPAELKGFVGAIVVIFDGIVGFTVSKLYQVITDHVGSSAIYFVFAISCFWAFVMVFICVPETKGKTYKEIKALLSGENLYSLNKEVRTVQVDIRRI